VKSLLEFNGVTKRFGDFTLREVSFSVPPGYIVGLVGPNGAGKTTLMRLALGLIRADGGVVRLLGEDPAASRAAAAARARVGFVHDTPACYDYLSVERVAGIVAPFYPTWDSARFSRLLAGFGVPPKAKLRSLSRGTKMKFALALALSHRAEILLLDEPTGGLDPVFRDRLLDLLSDVIGDARTSVLFSTQLVTDLERIADFIVIIREGRVMFSGPKDDILDRWAVVRGGPELATELAAASRWGVATTRQGVEALLEDVEEARRLFSGKALVEKATLEDAFLLCREPSGKGD